MVSYSYRPTTGTTHEHVITNTLFRLATHNKTTWMQPRSKHWHRIDYVISRKKDASDVRVTKSMCAAECWTDYRLLVSKLTLRIQPQRRPQGEKRIKSLNVAQLKWGPNAWAWLQTSWAAPWTSHYWGRLGSAQRQDPWHSFSVTRAYHAKKQDWFDENDEEIKVNASRKESSSHNLSTLPIICSQKDSVHQHS